MEIPLHYFECNSMEKPLLWWIEMAKKFVTEIN